MKSREARKREGRMMAVCWGAVAVVGLLLWLLLEGEPATFILECLQTLVLAITGGLVWWYTKETQRLRETAQQQVEETQRQTEVQQRPLIVIEPKRLGPLIVRNVGNSAAINIKITVLTSTVMIPLLTQGSGTSISIKTDSDKITDAYTYIEEGLSSHDSPLFIDHGSIQNGFTLQAEYQNVAMHTYVTEERITPDRFEILRS